MKWIISIVIIFSIFGCKSEPAAKSESKSESKLKPERKVSLAYESASLSIEQLTKSIYVHTSYLETQSFGKVGCNGMVYVNNGEAFIFDTPTIDSVSVELIDYVEQKLNAEIKGIVINHFHVDCLGGLKAFHKRNIRSYANKETIKLAKENNEIIPLQGFNGKLEIELGGEKILNEYFGAGHTADNIVTYIASENVLFGGCLIKKMGAGKGNLNDANINAWPITVAEIKKRYPILKYVIPGHGEVGGMELLDYTIKLFSEK